MMEASVPLPPLQHLDPWHWSAPVLQPTQEKCGLVAAPFRIVSIDIIAVRQCCEPGQDVRDSKLDHIATPPTIARCRCGPTGTR